MTAIRVAVLIALLGAAGCTGVPEPLRADLASPVPEVQRCAGWLAAVDDAVERAGVRDGEAFPIPGHPYLRVDRFLASFRADVADDPAAFAAWQARLRALDARTRAYELQNLPAPTLAALGSATWTDAAHRVDDCATVLSALDRADPARRTDLAARAQVPDDYADWKRVVGLYPLVRIPFFAFAKGWEREASAMFEAAAAGAAPAQPVIRYRPPDGAATPAEVERLFATVPRDALGVPAFDARDAERLFAAFAPVFEIETGGAYDRIGALRWGTGAAPEVDATQPVVYRRLAHTRYGRDTLVQIAYLIWFSERPDESWLDPLSGRLDGVFVRVTLDPIGRPLVYDSVHSCGCYHMFFPTARAVPTAAPDPTIEWAFVPRAAPPLAPTQRLVVRLTSRSHSLTDLRVDDAAAPAATPYALRDDAALRVLPTPDGTRSAFGPSGIVPGTERGERFLVWPLGIEDPGAMRVWGRHATALVGRRQFDDADLIERRFSLRPPVAAAAVPPGDAP